MIRRQVGSSDQTAFDVVNHPSRECTGDGWRHEGSFRQSILKGCRGDGEKDADLPGQTMTSHVTSTVDDPYITISAVDAG